MCWCFLVDWLGERGEGLLSCISNTLVWELGLFWYIICLAVFPDLHEQGHLRRTAVDSLGKASASGNGLVPYVSSFLVAFYLKGPSDTIYFAFLPKRRIAFPSFVASYNINRRTNDSKLHYIKLVRLCWVLAQHASPRGSARVLGAGQGWPAGTAWNSCSELWQMQNLTVNQLWTTRLVTAWSEYVFPRPQPWGSQTSHPLRGGHRVHPGIIFFKVL